MKQVIRILVAVFILFIWTGASSATIPDRRGLYVNGFSAILGNNQAEDSLLRYAYSNGYNYFILYEMSVINDWYDLTNPVTDDIFSNFVKKAKVDYSISIGVSSESYNTFESIFHIYQTNQTSEETKVDVFYFEFEYWIAHRSVPGSPSKYCERYLLPNGYSCDTLGAFQYYIVTLNKIDSLANSLGIISQTYIGSINAPEACPIATACDEILVHSYRTDDSDLYSYTRRRLSYLANCGRVVNVIPIFHCGLDYMGPWLMNYSLQKPYRIYMSEMEADTAAWLSNIQILGYHWYSWEDMKNRNIRPLPEATLISPTDGMLTYLPSAISLTSQISTPGTTAWEVTFLLVNTETNDTTFIPALSNGNYFEATFTPPTAGEYLAMVKVVSARYVTSISESALFEAIGNNDALKHEADDISHHHRILQHESGEYWVYDVNGRLWLNGNSISFNNAVLPTGIWIVRSYSDGEFHYSKLLVTH